MDLKVTEQELQLIQYFRGLTLFNQQRLMSIAGTAYENNQRTKILQANMMSGSKS
jgi:hypothetical protein